MFQFLKNLLGNSKDIETLPENLKLFSVLFDSGDFYQALFFLKKHKILPKDKILEKVNPHFYDYWNNSTNSAEWYENGRDVKVLKAKSDIKFYFPNYEKNVVHYVIPFFVKNFILDLTFLQNTNTDKIWLKKNVCKIQKNNIDTVVHCFTYMSKRLIDNKFKQLNIDNVDTIYIWLDNYSFKSVDEYNSSNGNWLETYQSNDLKNFPLKTLRFGTYAAYDFKKLIADLQFLGYDAELKDGYPDAKYFFKEIETETFK